MIKLINLVDGHLIVEKPNQQTKTPTLINEERKLNQKNEKLSNQGQKRNKDKHWECKQM